MSDRKKIRVGVIFGGRSVEHEVSLVSATSVMQALDKEKYEVVPIGITKEGKWLSSSETLRLLKSGQGLNLLPEKILVPDPTQRSLVQLDGKGLNTRTEPLDVIFPALHGPFGEDGTVQGLLELANIPYVGAGVLGSAVGMDKVVQKALFRQAGIPVTDSIHFPWKEYDASPEKHIQQIERTLGYPCFIKPANLGSSLGITKAHNRAELERGVEEAAGLIERYSWSGAPRMPVRLSAVFWAMMTLSHLWSEKSFHQMSFTTMMPSMWMGNHKPSFLPTCPPR